MFLATAMKNKAMKTALFYGRSRRMHRPIAVLNRSDEISCCRPKSMRMLETKHLEEVKSS